MEEISIEIPAGIDEGQNLRVPGLGQPAPGAMGEPGDLYVRVRLQPSQIFRREWPFVVIDYWLVSF